MHSFVDRRETILNATKQHLIDDIRRHNPTAQADFLIVFDEPALDRYLDHLRHRLQPRGGGSFWDRQPDTPAIVTRAR